MQDTQYLVVTIYKLKKLAKYLKYDNVPVDKECIIPIKLSKKGEWMLWDAPFVAKRKEDLCKHQTTWFERNKDYQNAYNKELCKLRAAEIKLKNKEILAEKIKEYRKKIKEQRLKEEAVKKWK